jgi:hypothetical protein
MRRQTSHALLDKHVTFDSLLQMLCETQLPMTKASKNNGAQFNSRGNTKIVTMTTVCCTQSPSVTGSKELTMNQIKSNPSITYKATTTENKDGSFRV